MLLWRECQESSNVMLKWLCHRLILAAHFSFLHCATARPILQAWDTVRVTPNSRQILAVKGAIETPTLLPRVVQIFLRLLVITVSDPMGKTACEGKGGAGLT